MPQPVRISINIGPNDLEGSPLTPHIAKIANLWAQIEGDLALLFAHGMMGEPAIAAAVMGNVANLATRLSMIRTALTLGVSQEAGDAFWKRFEQRIRKASKPRNRVVHSIWLQHADYPGDLIRTSGIMSPIIETERYQLSDFLEIEIALAKLWRDLKVFYESLPTEFPRADFGDQPPFWRPTEPDPPTEDDQDQ